MAPAPPPPFADVRPADLAVGRHADEIRRDFVAKLFCTQAKFPRVSTVHDHYQALAYVVRDRLLERWVESAHAFLDGGSRTVAYLSAEYLLGPQLRQNLVALDIEAPVREALAMLGLDLDTLVAHEVEPALGNGGLGRLAACFMDSLATLEIPAIGYGIRYEFGIFEQAIVDGAQVERTDAWLRLGCPWFVARPEITLPVGLGGHTRHERDASGRLRVRWVPERVVLGTPHDLPVLGHGTRNANLLRLWQAVAAEAFDLQAFNAGAYVQAVHDKIVSENITKVLYPNDDSPQGRRLRLEQQYFFVSCSLQDMLRIHRQHAPSLDGFDRKFAIQLNDTHPAVAVPELMRLLVDEHGMGWDDAWAMTRRCFAYTNHTLLPEALETWPVDLFGAVLPRHLEIVYEINRRFLDDVRARHPGDEGLVQRLSLIDEGAGRRVRMAHVACVGSHTVNGVAAIHSDLLRRTVLRDFAALWPDRFTNVTNGVTPRRFLRLANPPLATLVTEAIGPRWMRDLDELARLEPLADDPAFVARWQAVRREAKDRLARWLDPAGPALAPEALLDAQVKRIHEYKRQHLNLLHVITLYRRILDGQRPQAPRIVLFAGKAAPGYAMAKLIVRLIHAVAARVAAEPAVRAWLAVRFVPNLNVTAGERLYPAADLSEQISLAGTEASGTGNMKFALNGALTIGTLDGANVEIRDAVGAERFFRFGLDAGEVAARIAAGHDPREHVARDAELAAALALLGGGHFAPGEPGLFDPIVADLTTRDPFLVTADYRSYVDRQADVEGAWTAAAAWARASVRTVARMGRFSSDRAIREYASRVWRVESVPVGPGVQPS